MSSVRLKRGEISLGFVPSAPAYFQGVASNPSGTLVAFPGVMMGVPGIITPSFSGRVLMSITGSMYNTDRNCGGQVVLRYGTGIKPSTGDTPSGVYLGGLQSYVSGYPANSITTTPVNPSAGTTSTTGVMAGLGIHFTPEGTGAVVVTMMGSMNNSTTNDGAEVKLGYGFGTAPANGDSATGTTLSGFAYRIGPWTAGMYTPFSLTGVITGLTPGVPIWIDAVQVANVGGTANLFEVSVSAFEMVSILSANSVFPLSLSAIAAGLSVGTPYWLDVSANPSGGGKLNLQNVAICAHEF